MRFSVLGLGALCLGLAGACGSSNGGSSGNSNPGADSGSDSSSGSSSGGSGGSSGGGSGGGSSSGTTAGDAGDAGGLPATGNPDGSCTTLPLPSQMKLVDTSKPTTVVGTGTAASCTFDALNAAVTKGGIVTFDCGTAPVTIPVTATLLPPVSKGSEPFIDIVIDGGNTVTLDGQGAVRILSWVHNTWRANMDTLTLQRIRIVNGKTTPTQKIPACPPSGSISNTACSTGYDDGQGGALYMQDGTLRGDRQHLREKPGGPARPRHRRGRHLHLRLRRPGVHRAAAPFSTIRRATRAPSGCSAAGAFIFDSLFEGNSAVGTGANNNDATQCTCNNGGDAEPDRIGGNGGSIYYDGNALDVTICGTEIKGNTANEFGPAVFMTNDGRGGHLVIDDSLITGNSTPISYWQWCTDVSTDYPHKEDGGAGSPSPLNTTFCNASGQACTMKCST